MGLPCRVYIHSYRVAVVSLKASLQPLRTQKTTVDKNYEKHKFKMCWCYSTLYKQYFGHRSEQPLQERETGISENGGIYIETRVCSDHLLSLPSPQVAMKLEEPRNRKSLRCFIPE